jgi:predicted nucleic acid-binding protein
LCEALDVCRRTHRLGEREVRDIVEPLLLTGRLTAIQSGLEEAWRAADLRSRYYDRRTRALSLADCLLLAHAHTDGGELATADPSVAEVAREEGLALIPLPDSSGRLP